MKLSLSECQVHYSSSSLTRTPWPLHSCLSQITTWLTNDLFDAISFIHHFFLKRCIFKWKQLCLWGNLVKITLVTISWKPKHTKLPSCEMLTTSTTGIHIASDGSQGSNTACLAPKPTRSLFTTCTAALPSLWGRDGNTKLCKTTHFF